MFSPQCADISIPWIFVQFMQQHADVPQTPEKRKDKGTSAAGKLSITKAYGYECVATVATSQLTLTTSSKI